MRKTTKRTRMVICRTNQECTPKILNAHSHKPFSAPNHRTINILRHKAFSTPSHRIIQQSFDVPDRYAKQIKLQKESEERIKRLNKKYNLDYYSSSESDSDFYPEPDYRYKHKYETLI